MERSPHQELMDAERAFFDELYAGRAADVASPIPTYIMQRFIQRFWDAHVGGLAGRRVLECGAGDGTNAVWLASRGADVVAVELSRVGVERTRERARFHDLDDRVTAFCGDCLQLGELLGDESIDLAVGFCVLHHLPTRDFGRSLVRVLKPGARAVFCENSASPLYRAGRAICSNESAAGAPLARTEVDEFLREIGGGYSFHPTFGLFSLTQKHILPGSRRFAACVEALDRVIDLVPGTRRWSAYQWVVGVKPSERPLPTAAGRLESAPNASDSIA